MKKAQLAEIAVTEKTLLAVITEQKELMEELLGEYKLDFLRWVFLNSMEKTQQVGSTRKKNSFVINGQKIVRRSLWLPSICWTMPFNGTSGLRKQGQMFHGRNLHMLCVSVLGHRIMKTLMKL